MRFSSDVDRNWKESKNLKLPTWNDIYFSPFRVSLSHHHVVFMFVSSSSSLARLFRLLCSVCCFLKCLITKCASYNFKLWKQTRRKYWSSYSCSVQSSSSSSTYFARSFSLSFAFLLFLLPLLTFRFPWPFLGLCLMFSIGVSQSQVAPVTCGPHVFTCDVVVMPHFMVVLCEGFSTDLARCRSSMAF